MNGIRITIAILTAAVAMNAALAEVKLTTEWGEKVTAENAWRMYPRPEMVRGNWESLNGYWDFGIGKWYEDELPKCDRKILVPFPVESPLSGVDKLVEPTDVMVYERRFTAAKRANERTLLHFESVDYRAQVFVNGIEVTEVPHEGYSMPFELDVTAALKDGENELRVVAWDPTNEGWQALGKQHLKPQHCFFTRNSGIMGSVWLERVPMMYVKSYKVATDAAKETVTVTVSLGGGPMTGAAVNIAVLDGEKRVAVASAIDSTPVEIKLPAGAKKWSPENPFLYSLDIRLAEGDAVKGYFGLRTIEKKLDARGHPSFFLNGKKIYLLATLDQGWWPDGLLTPPSEEAMRFDVEMLKKAGFNAIRKHIKVEPRRFYYDCDRLGMMIMQDMPSGEAIPTEEKVERTGVRWVEWDDLWRVQRYGEFRREFKEMLDHLQMHPSIVMWVPFNECWGQPRRTMTKMVYDWAKRYDPTRIYDGPSGWWDWWQGGVMSPTNAPNVTAVLKGDKSPADTYDRHDYSFPPVVEILPESGCVAMLSEYGSAGMRVKGHCWLGDKGTTAAEDQAARERLFKSYAAQAENIRKLAEQGLGASAFCETTDVEYECCGLMTYDRRVLKYDLDKLREVHCRILDAAGE